MDPINNREREQILSTLDAIQDIGAGIEAALIGFDQLPPDLPYQGPYLLFYLTMAQRMITGLAELYLPYVQQKIGNVQPKD